jgi:membrane-anchored glycerophosphoryl diester phosphodiesterase (GDPDase)
LKLLLKYEGKWGLYCQLRATPNGYVLKLLTIIERYLMHLQKTKDIVDESPRRSFFLQITVLIIGLIAAVLAGIYQYQLEENAILYTYHNAGCPPAFIIDLVNTKSVWILALPKAISFALPIGLVCFLLSLVIDDIFLNGEKSSYQKEEKKLVRGWLMFG